MRKYIWPRDIARREFDAEELQQSKSSFERRFRIRRIVFTNILKGVLVESDYFRKGMWPNAVGKLGIFPLVKVICALRQISHDIPSDLAEDMFEVSETTAFLCLDEFCKAVESLFRAKYLRKPTDEDLIRIERRFARVGFPECIGCVDCEGWEWQSCLKPFKET
ncbi:hypothetical protein BWQ96_03202 [Gracilariopsis chorda]|uniref:Uncharacterized protein n=1 Tax=Gracilariopsis chorda TaxID=448386 RepID=A0A2V3IXY7_9FLOR|nr:hypothetical protein BWQ96_03202 [Gracilariopsis chorda]|eukprot:PXF47012.1 hypothetical protein BWQ96_03202 [Gracilariopsis chorda]